MNLAISNRDIDFADLIIVGSAPEAYRLNLSEGRFLAPLPLSSGAANAVRAGTELKHRHLCRLGFGCWRLLETRHLVLGK